MASSADTVETRCGDWILEFLLLHLHSKEDWIIDRVIPTLSFTKSNPKFNRLFLLRKIDSDSTRSEVSARTLKALEAYAEDSEASEILRDLCRRVALECALRHLRASEEDWVSFKSELADLRPRVSESSARFQWRNAAAKELDYLLMAPSKVIVRDFLRKYRRVDLLKDLHAFVADARQDFGASALEEFSRNSDETVPETTGRDVAEESASAFPRPPWSSEYLDSSSRRRSSNTRGVAKKSVDVTTLPTNDQSLNSQQAPEKSHNRLSSKSCTPGIDKETSLRKDRPDNDSDSRDCLSQEFRKNIKGLRKSTSDLQLAEEEVARKRHCPSRSPNASGFQNLIDGGDCCVNENENEQVLQQQGEQSDRAASQHHKGGHNSADCIPQDNGRCGNPLERAKASEPILRKSPKHSLMDRNSTARTFEQQGEQSDRAASQQHKRGHNSADCIPQDNGSHGNPLERAKAGEPILRKSPKHSLMDRNSTARTFEQQGEQSDRAASQQYKGGHNSADRIPKDNGSRGNPLERAKASEQILRKSPKRSLMDRNSTACTFEWNEDNQPSGQQEKSPSDSKNIQLESPKLKRFSPLKIKQTAGIGLRRRRNRWTTFEEETLKKEVFKYGVGRWKFILQNNLNVFEDRTEVDLKDKWRNIAKRDGIEGDFL